MLLFTLAPLKRNPTAGEDLLSFAHDIGFEDFVEKCKG